MRSFLDILKYNNAVPIGISFLLLSTASTYAATNPEIVYTQQQEVLSTDNTYISEVDLKKNSPTVQVISVKEDALYYYVEYTFSTIALVDAVWQDAVTTEVMQIEKKRLGKYRDLGLYVTEELNEKIFSEKRRLAETQNIEKLQKTNKKISTKYAGLVGGLLSDTVTEIPKYKPVVKPPKPKQEVATFARPPENVIEKKTEDLPVTTPEVPAEAALEPQKETVPPKQGSEEVGSGPSEGTSGVPTVDSAETDSSATNPSATENEAPYLTILGNNPVVLVTGATYTDLGVMVSDDTDVEVTTVIYINNVLVTSVSIDTATSGVYSIVYEAIDSEGAASQVERIVMVENAVVGTSADEEILPDSDLSAAPDALDVQIETPSETPPEPVPEPEPMPVLEPTPEPVPEPVVEPATETVPEPEPPTEPTQEPTV